jgi:hypothetical protein
MKKILKAGIGHKTQPTMIENPFLKGRKLGLFVNFGKFLCFWTRIRIPNTDPDSGQLNECGSMRVRIHDNVKISASDRVPFMRVPILSLARRGFNTLLAFF